MANVQNNVSFGKPKATGAVFVAPLGTALPTNATAALNAAFVSMGYISEDGLVNTVATDTEDIMAWGGERVLSAQTSYMESFNFNLLETNSAALGLYYGAANVSTDASGNITVNANGKTLPNVELVFEMVMTGGRIKRIVVPNAQMVDRSGDVTYTDGDPVTYPAVFTAYPDANGNTHIEYITAVAS